jgi:hypothetical protein
MSKDLKVVKNVKVQDFRGTDRVGIGVVTDDGKYLVSAMCRQGSPRWSPSRNSKDVEVNILNRVDISISEWNGDKQGEYIMPYVSHRIMQTRLASGDGSCFEASVFDNENTRTQFKNAILAPRIFTALKKAVDVASLEFAENVKAGKSIAAPLSTIAHAQELIEASMLLSQRRGTHVAVVDSADVQSARDALAA